jgi:hypothetical protein
VSARRIAPWLVLLVVLVGVAVVAGAPTGRSDRPLDPRANGPRGAKAVVVLLTELGAEVGIERGAPSAGDATALVLRDRFDDDDRADVRRWVEDGGVLMLADPTSPLLEGLADPSCPEAASAADAIRPGPVADTAVERSTTCFDDFVGAHPLGAGTIVSIGSPLPFTNRFLDDVDNAVLAAALLAPTGRERVAFVQGPAGAGDEALVDLLGPSVAQGIVQLAVAFVVYVLWRGRRLGRPVVERQAVVVAGSELVTAVGRMLEGRHQPSEAADRVRADVRRALERRLGLPVGAPVERLADAVAARTGLDPATVVAALATRPVTTDGDLVDVVDDLDRIRDLALGGQ